MSQLSDTPPLRTVTAADRMYDKGPQNMYVTVSTSQLQMTSNSVLQHEQSMASSCHFHWTDWALHYT